MKNRKIIQLMLIFGMVLSILGISMGYSFAEAPTVDSLPGPNKVNLNISNHDSTRYESNGQFEFFPLVGGSGGMNAAKIRLDNVSTTDGQYIKTTNKSGSFYVCFTGGVNTRDTVLLMIAVNGTIAQDFKITLTASGYTWNYIGTPNLNDVVYTTTLSDTFTYSDFKYNSTWKPTYDSDYPLGLLQGQDPSYLSNMFYIMFIDLDVNSINNNGLIDNGRIKVDYVIENLASDSSLAFNIYGYVSGSEGVGWTNNIANTGYVVYSLDYTALEVAISANETFKNGVNSADFTSASWNSFIHALDDAIAMKTSKNATSQSEIGALISTLGAAYLNLVPIDYAALEVAISSNETFKNGVNSGDYTSASWNSFMNALNSAIAMNTSKNAATQSEIDALVSGLSTAYSNLILISNLDYDALEAGIVANETFKNGVNSGDYTSASWNSFINALNSAIAMNTSKNAASQADIDALISSLASAYSGLTFNSVNNNNLPPSNPSTPSTPSNPSTPNPSKPSSNVSKPTTKLSDLKITKVKKVGNKYKITIKNQGAVLSGKSKVMIYCGCKKFTKIYNVKALAKSKSVTITVKFSSKAKKHVKYAKINYNNKIKESNYKNNIYKIGK